MSSLFRLYPLIIVSSVKNLVIGISFVNFRCGLVIGFRCVDERFVHFRYVFIALRFRIISSELIVEVRRRLVNNLDVNEKRRIVWHIRTLISVSDNITLFVLSVPFAEHRYFSCMECFGFGDFTQWMTGPGLQVYHFSSFWTTKL